MISDDELKAALQSELPQKEKLLAVLGSFDEPCGIAEIREKAAECGLKIPRHWNPSARLKQARGMAILTTRGWEIAKPGLQHLKNLGVGANNPAAIHVATALRAQLEKIANHDTRAFVEEAIKCYEAELWRAAIVMSWLAAVDVLHHEVFRRHRVDFDAEMARIEPKWKPLKSPDDFSRLGEAEFLDRAAAISVIGKNVKVELKQCLDRRNGCGHPNSLKIGSSTVTHHFEILLLNVFSKFG